MKRAKIRLIYGLGIVFLLAAAYAILTRTELLALVGDEQRLHAFLSDSGWYGPLCIIGLMTVAIVMSPLPSAPIAMAAGLAYGHTWGTLYVVIGSEAGALIAFGIGRLVGYDTLQKWFGEKLKKARFFGSQNLMMAAVFFSRLLPFVSFDIVSYAAGLTPLAFWRFAVATLAGIVPASFLLARFGSTLASGESKQILLASLALGLLTLLPFAGRWLYGKFRSGK